MRDARRRLAALEHREVASHHQPDLFAALPPVAEAEPHPLIAAVAAIDPDALTPREALERLYELKKLLG